MRMQMNGHTLLSETVSILGCWVLFLSFKQLSRSSPQVDKVG